MKVRYLAALAALVMFSCSSDKETIRVVEDNFVSDPALGQPTAQTEDDQLNLYSQIEFDFKGAEVTVISSKINCRLSSGDHLVATTDLPAKERVKLIQLFNPESLIKASLSSDEAHCQAEIDLVNVHGSVRTTKLNLAPIRLTKGNLELDQISPLSSLRRNQLSLITLGQSPIQPINDRLHCEQSGALALKEDAQGQDGNYTLADFDFESSENPNASFMNYPSQPCRLRRFIASDEVHLSDVFLLNYQPDLLTSQVQLLSRNLQGHPAPGTGIPFIRRMSFDAPVLQVTITNTTTVPQKVLVTESKRTDNHLYAMIEGRVTLSGPRTAPTAMVGPLSIDLQLDREALLQNHPNLGGPVIDLKPEESLHLSYKATGQYDCGLDVRRSGILAIYGVIFNEIRDMIPAIYQLDGEGQSLGQVHAQLSPTQFADRHLLAVDSSGRNPFSPQIQWQSFQSATVTLPACNPSY